MRLVWPGRILLLAATLLAWQFAAVTMGKMLLGTPWDVALRLGEWIGDGTLAHHLAVTLGEALSGLAAGGAGGVLAGLVLHTSRAARRILVPWLRAAMGIPKLALMPLAILWFGIGAESKIVLIGLIVFFMLFEATMAGLDAADVKLVMMARVLGASRMQLARRIALPALAPFLFAAAKTATPWAVSVAVIGELLGGESGLGWLIANARDVGDMTGMCAGVVVVTLLVLALDAALGRSQARSLRWRAVDSRATL